MAVSDYTFAYDTWGNQTDDGTNYTYVYDAFGRVRQIKHRTTAALISEHTYNGLGFRIGWHYDADADADVDGDDPDTITGASRSLPAACTARGRA